MPHQIDPRHPAHPETPPAQTVGTGFLVRQKNLVVTCAPRYQRSEMRRGGDTVLCLFYRQSNIHPSLVLPRNLATPTEATDIAILQVDEVPNRSIPPAHGTRQARSKLKNEPVTPSGYAIAAESRALAAWDIYHAQTRRQFHPVSDARSGLRSQRPAPIYDDKTRAWLWA